MSNPTNEEQAFPAHLTTKTIWGDVAIRSSPGLTKRELFAAMAMQAILTGAVTRACPASEWFDMGPAVLAADALITALTVSKEQP